MQIKIVVAGPRGNMGKEAIKMIEQEEKFQLVGCIDRINDGKTLQEIGIETKEEVRIFTNPVDCFTKTSPDVYVDLTIPQVGYQHTTKALEHGVRSVVGTSGFSSEQIEHLGEIARNKHVGCIIAPNFALGAVLMMHFAKIAAKYFSDVEIIEKHHDNKIDAPSGTAVKTIEMIQEVRKPKQQGHPEEFETIQGARGGEVDGIRVHSVRLPGLVAHQEVIFGSKSQLFTIKHDSFHRESFMDGLKLAIVEVMQLEHLVYGLENVMDLKE